MCAILVRWKDLQHDPDVNQALVDGKLINKLAAIKIEMPEQLAAKIWSE